jgi:putative DNA primase/helicase
MGNAERFVSDHKSDVRFVAEWGKGGWMEYGGGIWVPDKRIHVLERAKTSVRNLYHEAAEIEDEGLREALVDHAKKSQHIQRLKAMVDLARSDEKIAAESRAFDADPLVFNVANGTIDLRSGELREHSRLDMLTKQSPVAYDEDAKFPLFSEFLLEIMNRDIDLCAYLQRVFGYWLTGSTEEQLLWVFHGSGANGKSTLMSVLAHIFGNYGAQPPIDAFLVHKFRPPTQPDLMDLAGARIAVSTELEPGRRLSEDLVKRSTGGESITGRRLYENPWSYQPQFKLAFVVNSLPGIRGQDEAIWRRVRKIPFTVTIPPDQRDTKLLGKLEAEAPGILSWMVEGCLNWRDLGLLEPDSVKTATSDYKDEMDLLADWIAEEQVRTGSDLSERASELYESFKGWAGSTNHFTVSQTAFGRMLEDRGFTREKKGSFVIRHGISLRESHHDS